MGSIFRTEITQKKQIQVSHKENPALLSMKSWLVNDGIHKINCKGFFITIPIYWQDRISSPPLSRWNDPISTDVTNFFTLSSLLGCPRKLGSMVRIKVISPTYKWGITWGYNPLILTINPNFQRDIQVMTSRWLKVVQLHLPVSNHACRCYLDRRMAHRWSRWGRDFLC